MKLGNWGRISILAVSLVAVNGIRCGSDDTGEGGSGLCEGALPDEADVVYAGNASDEAIERLWDKRCHASSDAGLAPELASPVDGASVPAETPVELEWEGGVALAPVPRIHTAPGGGSRFQLSFGLPVAWAHLPPITGWVYLVELRGAGGSLWLFTTERSWTPDPVAWNRMVSMGRIEVRITSAYLNQNVVEEGPYASGQASVFTIEAP